MSKVKEDWQGFSEEVYVQRPTFLERDQKGPAAWLVLLLHVSPGFLVSLNDNTWSSLSITHLEK